MCGGGSLDLRLLHAVGGRVQHRSGGVKGQEGAAGHLLMVKDEALQSTCGSDVIGLTLWWVGWLRMSDIGENGLD